MIKKYNKLVRDYIPDIISKDGKKANIRVLSDDEYLIELNKKLFEEINEYLSDYSIEELADIQEVINALVIANGYTLDSFNKLRNAKCKKRGAFEKKIYLESVEENE